MSLYLVAGHGAATGATVAGRHLPTDRPRRYPSDTTDAEWQVMAGYIPVGGTVAGRGGGPVTYPRRDIVDAIRYLDHNSCVWRALPVDFPPWPTVYYYFRTWNRDGTLTRLHNGLREQVRTAEGRHSEPSAAILDSQSVRAAETVATTSRGFDGAKKVPIGPLPCRAMPCGVNPFQNCRAHMDPTARPGRRPLTTTLRSDGNDPRERDSPAYGR